MVTIDEVRDRLVRYEPVLAGADGLGQGAVAVLLREGADGAEVLLIERSEHDGDPWSGHIAFPGGRVEQGDPSPRKAAERETLEETGFDLREAEYLGRLDDVRGRTVGIRVSAFVYHAARAWSPVPNHEVADLFWVPLTRLTSPERHVVRTFRFREREADLPAVDILGPGRPVLWGLTYRLLQSLIRIVGNSDLRLP